MGVRPPPVAKWPLVSVLREAPARDDLDRAKHVNPRVRIGTSRSAVRAFIHTVHHFRDATLRDPATPTDHAVVFEEAQRTWDARQVASFMTRKKGLPDFTQTEPELLIGAMERHADWAVVVCLVGGGRRGPSEMLAPEAARFRAGMSPQCHLPEA